MTRRLVRLISAVAAALSLLLLVAASVLWVRSYGAGDSWGWSPRVPGRSLYAAQALRGRFKVMVLRPPYDQRPPGFSHGHAWPELWAELPWSPGRGWDAPGAGYRAERLAPGFDARLVWVSFGWACALAAPLPSFRMLRFVRRRRRTRRNRCPACGYDLRARPDPPECGAAPAAAGAARGSI